MSKTGPLEVDLTKCRRLEDFEVWVDDESGKIVFYNSISGLTYSRIPRELRGLATISSGQAAKRKPHPKTSKASAVGKEDADLLADQSEAVPARSPKKGRSKRPKRDSAALTSITSARTVTQGEGEAGGEEDSTKERGDSSSMAKKDEKDREAALQKLHAEASQALLSLSDTRQESVSVIQVMLAQLATDKFRIWKKKDAAMELLESRCNPCVKLLISFIPEELPGEWEVHDSLRKLRDSLQGTQFNTPTKPGKGLFKKVKTEGSVILASLKAAMRTLERHFQSVDCCDPERVCVSAELLPQIFASSNSGCDAWKALSENLRPDSAKEGEVPFSVPFLIVWRALMQNVPTQWRMYGTLWRSAVSPLLESSDATIDAPSSVSTRARVSALAFSDFAVIFAPLERWWEQVNALLIGSPDFFWFALKPTSRDPNVYVKKPKAGQYLFRFSASKRRRIVLQFISEMAMQAAETQGGTQAQVRWDNVAIRIVANAEQNGCVYQCLGEQYGSLSDIVSAYREHFKYGMDKSRFCLWFWGDPISRDSVVQAIGAGPEGSFAVVRTKSEKAGFALFHKGPQGVQDFLITRVSGAFSIDFHGTHVSAKTMTELVHAATRHGSFCNVMPLPHINVPLRGRFTSQPTVYFDGMLRATS